MKDKNIDVESPLTLNNRRHGMTVPSGYFEDFAKRMEESLPSMPFERGEGTSGAVVMQRTLWQKIRPYVYMAAMFAGVWCMMKVFDNVRSAATRPSLEVKPNSVLAEALSNDQFVEQYFYNGLNDDDLMWLDLQEDVTSESVISDQNTSKE